MCWSAAAILDSNLQVVMHSSLWGDLLEEEEAIDDGAQVCQALAPVSTSTSRSATPARAHNLMAWSMLLEPELPQDDVIQEDAVVIIMPIMISLHNHHLF